MEKVFGTVFLPRQIDSVKNIYEHPEVTIDQSSGKLTLVSSGITFSRGDGIWPWPIVFPDKFLAWSQLAAVIIPDYANPLTGLLKNKKDPPAQTLAEQLTRKLMQISASWAREIVEGL